ncbi:MAG TPA: FGGY family carbohydrate kinase [Gaiellaceae bacterium]|nr:FGGY family carbohydrate kinase [Gaiellaceae bacterium]
MILAVDQGTTGTTCLVVDDELNVRGRGYVPVSLATPRPGWVEQDPEELWTSVERAAEVALADAGITAADLDALGIANQRETTIVWDRRSGEPVYPAIVWQDRRTAERCRDLPAERIRTRTGLTCDPYFSATKLEWILRETGACGDLAFGTVDSWLVWKLTRGAVHATDVTNASRTMLIDLTTLDWDDELLALFSLDRSILPAVHPSAHEFGEGRLLGATVPIGGIAGDQQASLHAHGTAKVTIGTGAFLLVPSAAPAPHGLIRTASVEGFALEGSVFAATAALEWVRALTGADPFLSAVDSTKGVYFVPALTGLGSPHWSPDARGRITGLSLTTRREHLVRAALESIAYQVLDVVDALPDRPAVLGADGGATANGFLMQFLADALQLPVEVAAEREMTALGAAALIRPDAPPRAVAARYEPGADVSALVAGWRDAIRRTVV